MIPYQTKKSKLSGTSYGEVRKNTLKLFNEIKRKTKRRPYIASAYFKKQKVFFDYFWKHLFEKRQRERMHRLRYFEAAKELFYVQIKEEKRTGKKYFMSCFRPK